MRLISEDLRLALTEGLTSGDPNIMAKATNIAWDETTSDPRQVFFETEDVGHRGPTWEDLHKRQSDYVGAFIFTDDDPHTFLKNLRPASVGLIDDAQLLVRVEQLTWPLGLNDLTFEALSIARTESDQPLLESFVDVWNDNRDRRPAFATFKHEIAEDLEAGNWAERLRDRLGLAHIGAEPIALMEYPVRQVLAERRDGTDPITVPSVLDSRPWEHFFPAPRDLVYGRAMALSPCEGDEMLVAEVLHSRVTYKPEHITRVAALTTLAPVHDVTKRRELHTLAVQIASGREDFGA